MQAVSCNVFVAFLLASQAYVAEGEKITKTSPILRQQIQKIRENPPGAESLPVHHQEDKLGTKDDSIWSRHPIALALVLGFVLIGPDHLGTLMALSTLTSGIDSFKVGFLWGLGHSVGMIMICPLFLLVKSLAIGKLQISLEQWEYFGDYFIGASMILVASYFFFYESSYLELQADGTYKAKGCACHVRSPSRSPSRADESLHDNNFCSAFGKYVKTNCASPRGKRARSVPVGVPPVPEGAEESPVVGKRPSRRSRSPFSILGGDRAFPDHEEDCQEDSPLVEKEQSTSFLSFTLRDMQGALLGGLQGLCCPMGFAGVFFLGHMSISSSVLGLCLFAGALVAASALGSGFISFSWGTLTTKGSATCIAPRAMYRASCLFTMFFGTLWIVANAAGVLDNINFAEKIQSDLMPVQPVMDGP